MLATPVLHHRFIAPNPRSSRHRSARGIVIAEVLVALALLVAVIAGVVQLFVYTARATRHGQRLTSASVLAAQKLDQLRSLTWSYDAAGVPVGDMQTDTSQTPEAPAGGTGLTPGPLSTLDANTDGYCDFVDGQGRQLGGGTSAPPGTAFVRRWAIRPVAADPVDTLAVAVRVLSAEAAARNAGDATAVTMATVRTRLMW